MPRILLIEKHWNDIISAVPKKILIRKVEGSENESKKDFVFPRPSAWISSGGSSFAEI